MLVLTLGLNIGALFGLVGSGTVIASGLLIAIGVAAGYLLGGPDERHKRTLAVATGQRNLAAAFVVGTGSFAAQPNVLAIVAVAGLIATLGLFPVAGELGRRSKTTERVTAATPAERDQRAA